MYQRIFYCIILWIYISIIHAFHIFNDSFIHDNQEFRILSGSLHYQRIVPEYWNDRIQRVKALGLNTISTYVPWNIHEPHKGIFNFNKFANLVRFIELVHQNGMFLILRPGPYICGEWDFGGLPAWLLQNDTIAIRTFASPYIQHVDDWLAVLLPLIKPHLHVNNGGPIIMVQVENEYGSFGNVAKNLNDRLYLKHLITIFRKYLGDQVILFTTDMMEALRAGTFPGEEILSLADGCSNINKTLENLRQFNPPGRNPFLCTEVYTGWITHWGDSDARTPAWRLSLVERLLHHGSINLYMAHGGTNFGFWSGANNGSPGYQSDITSYDYDAPISENGAEGWSSDDKNKFEILKSYLAPYAKQVPQLPHVFSLKRYPTIELLDSVALLNHLPMLVDRNRTFQEHGTPRHGEAYGCHFGWIVYETEIDKDASNIDLPSFHDRLTLFADGVQLYSGYRSDMHLHGISLRTTYTSKVRLPRSMTGANKKVTIITEHLGRVNFGSSGMKDARIGLLGPLLVDGKQHTLWNISCVDFANHIDWAHIPWEQHSTLNSSVGDLRLYRGGLFVDQVADTYLNMNHMGKGVVLLNGFNLGRYWTSMKTQQTLYVPAPLLRKGRNEIIVLETENIQHDVPMISTQTFPSFTRKGISQVT